MNYQLSEAVPDHRRFVTGCVGAMKHNCVKPMMVGVNKAALKDNLHTIKSRLGNHGLCAVLKGDAYGHGIDIVAPEIIAACSHVAVVDNYELGIVRNLDAEIPLLRLRVGSDFEIVEAAEKRWRVREMVASLPKVKEISRIAGRLGQQAEIHLSLDAAGLGRNGLNISDAESFDALLLAILDLPNIHVASVGCHLPDAGDADPVERHDPSRLALRRFSASTRRLLQLFNDRGIQLPEVSAFSSASSCAFGHNELLKDLHQPVFDRIGSSLFGLTVQNRHAEKNTRQVMHVGTFVCDVVHRRQGEKVGYEHCYRVNDPTGERIALLGTGWLSLSRYQQGEGKSITPAFGMNQFGGSHLFLGRQSMNISTIRARGSDGYELSAGDLLFLTTDFGPVDAVPSISKVAWWMGGVQPEFVTSTFGGSASSTRFLF